jgi:uncharacterized protein with HEPN domain
MPPDDHERVRHMLDAAREAREFSAGRTRADLDSDRILALALTRLVEIIGEAAKNVSPVVRLISPDIRWKEIGGARDRLAHGYYSVDLDILWGILTRDLPVLEPALVALLARLDPRTVS